MESHTSIIVPFYNEENLLEQSVLDLVKEDFLKEIILVNDGSLDSSKVIDGLKYIFAIFKYK